MRPDPQERVPGLANYANVPEIIALLVAGNMASLHELQTVYSVQDAYTLLEILIINRHNENRIIKWQSQRN